MNLSNNVLLDIIVDHTDRLAYMANRFKVPRSGP